MICGLLSWRCPYDRLLYCITYNVRMLYDTISFWKNNCTWEKQEWCYNRRLGQEVPISSPLAPALGRNWWKTTTPNHNFCTRHILPYMQRCEGIYALDSGPAWNMGALNSRAHWMAGNEQQFTVSAAVSQCAILIRSNATYSSKNIFYRRAELF
jgi:hypothetical protein